MNGPDRTSFDSQLPPWVDRAVLDEILKRIPPEARQPFLDFLAVMLKELKLPEGAVGITTEGDPELSQLLARLLERVG